VSERAELLPSLRIRRVTAETRFELVLRPRTRSGAQLALPNRLLAHFLDHFCRATGLELELASARWPGSWEFDHVLCEDLGQLLGRAIAELAGRRSRAGGIPGRAGVRICLDDARVELALSLEGRPRASWSIPAGCEIDGPVDAWYEDGRQAGIALGTNLRQFVDGFAQGSGATLAIAVQEAGNLHHLYEALFRALGDAVRAALALEAGRLAGDGSGVAGSARYEIAVEEPA
jgi:imidazoleglycerol-phosphate dehydratase